ncbi:sensor histidine kinase KdpD [Cereibacter sp. SYSU M97828]|nr:sensor histidine kinase KdpD [Cereibacter flavus]
MNDPRPDALLEAAARETRGRLKIFLGAAPGVGKTWEMLVSARAEERDTVIGIVETHGRAETEALVHGFEVIARRKTHHRGQPMTAMDLDAIIARAPELALVDELAHTNAPGSRHPKRYMDVEELLSRGIDVWTTLNIQHVESLNDVVAQITRIRVRETVPDSVLDRAEDIEIIDLTPDDLLKRLREGKVYLPKTADRAIRNYFRPGNLTALRELALRRTAQRVDDQLVSHMQANAIPGPWAAGDRVLVCIDEHPRSAGLVRYARRHADRMRAPWTALHVETGRAATLSEAERDSIAASMRLAGQIGAEVVTLPGEHAAKEILRYAKSGNFTQIIIGKSGKPRWREWWEGSVASDLIHHGGDISVHVISGSDAPPLPKSSAPRGRVRLRPYLSALAFVTMATGIGTVMSSLLDVRNIALVFLMAVLATALRSGLWPALFASVVGAFAFNFFFLQPLFTLDISDPESVVALGFFFAVSVVASNLTAHIQRQAATARARARTTEGLFQFSKKLSSAGTLDDVLWAAAYQFASMLNVRVVILLPEGGGLAVMAGYPPEDRIDEADMAAARWTWDHDRAAGRGADTLPGAKRLFLPLRTGTAAVGVVGLDNDRTGPVLTPEEQRLFDALADQAALAIGRIQLVAGMDRARLAAEADRLRSALLTSVSHDLKTPLAGIIGAAGTLRDFDLPGAERAEMIGTIIGEGERLHRFIANLLDMTRIETGAKANLTPLDPEEAIETGLARAAAITRAHVVRRVVAEGLPMIRVDPVLLDQVFFNLLDNAAKYAPEGSTIHLRAWRDGRHVLMQVMDEGPGLAPEDLERVFDSFYRAAKGDTVRAGTGLGLSICRGFVEAMDGTIAAANRSDRSGAVFTIRLPAEEKP